MLYDKSIKRDKLDILRLRVSSFNNIIVNLISEGYIPNKNKTTIVNWSGILIHAYENIDVLDKERQAKIDNLFDKVIHL